MRQTDTGREHNGRNGWKNYLRLTQRVQSVEKVKRDENEWKLSEEVYREGFDSTNLTHNVIKEVD